MQLTTQPDIGLPPRRFLEEGFDPTNVEALKSKVQELLDREILTVKDLEQWTLDQSELSSQVGAALARRYIAMTCDTKDEEAREAYLSFQKNVIPEFSVLSDKLNKHFLKSPFKKELGKRYEVFIREAEKEAEIFREENTKLAADDSALAAAYSQIQGKVTIEHGGKTLTAQQAGALLEEKDRGLREEVWRKIGDRRLEDVEEIEDLFDKMVALRTRMAKNAGFANFRDYIFEKKLRFDYGPADCEAFHEAVEQVVVPVLGTFAEERKTRLGLDTLRPWDTAVKLSGGEPSRPFKDQEGYIELTKKIFQKVDPFFAQEFDKLVRNDMLDLMSREGKAPGGYQYVLEDIRLPFIFINAVGSQRDLRVLLHEGGHAFHSLLCRDEPLVSYRHSPMEFAEVASMSMELLGFEQMDKVIDPGEARESFASFLKDALATFSWVATIDAFQHWIYTNPEHSREERRAKWNEIRQRFGPHVDYSGIEKYQDYLWHRQGHIFGSPFYYIEYAIAQIGAFQVWLKEREDHEQAIKAYKDALSLGGSRPLPELFRTAGGRFAMDAEMLGTLVPEVTKKIEELQAETA
ncbi:MAG TPA: M3 family oligoendopeptidase [Planctomycetes bacterium]|nr:M3 family oligoendopeptidase [Planctomycetota bacterium]